MNGGGHQAIADQQYSRADDGDDNRGEAEGAGVAADSAGAFVGGFFTPPICSALASDAFRLLNVRAVAYLLSLSQHLATRLEPSRAEAWKRPSAARARCGCWAAQRGSADHDVARPLAG